MKAEIIQPVCVELPMPQWVCDISDVESVLGLFREISCEQQWQPGTYLDTAPDNSEHLAIVIGGIVVGGLQAVFADKAGKLPYLHVWPEVIVPKSSAHVTILGVRPECRGKADMFWSLVCELWSLGTDRGIECYLLEATPPMLSIYRRMGLPLEVIGELRMHWGEPCYLTKVDPIAFAGGVVIRARKSAIFNNRLNILLRPACVSAIVEAPQPQVAAV